MNLRIITHLCLLLCLGFSAAYAQNHLQNEPFKVGEVLKYEAKLTKSFVRGVSLGGADITFTVSSAPNGKDYLFLTEAVSKGNLLKLFGFKFLEKFESTVEKENFRVLKTVKHDEQGERVRDSEAVFDYRQKLVAYTEIDPVDTARAPRRIASAIQDNTLDVVSGLYSLRKMPLSVGKTFELSISDSGLVYKIPVRVSGRELLNSVLGKVWCFRIEPEVFGTNRLIEDKGKMILWITEESRILIRSEISANIGKIEVKLKKSR